MYKISEQQLLNPKVVSVANSCDNNENSKNGINRLQTNARGTYPKKSPRQKLGCNSPRVGANFWCKPRGWAEGCLWQKLIAPLTQLTPSIFWMQMKSATSSLHCSTVPLFYWIVGW